MERMGKTTLLKRFAMVLAAVLLWAVSGCAGPGRPVTGEDDLQRIADRYPAFRPDSAERGNVVKVVDGDTFELSGGEKVRLIGVNTPETHGKAEPYGKEAASFVKKELLGQPVVMYADVSDRDRFGRLLRYVFVAGQNVMFNERLVTEGFAQVMTIPPNVAFAETFLELQRDARSRNAGLWGAPAGNNGRKNAAQEPSAPEASPSCPDPIKGNINARGDKIYHVPGGVSYENTKPEQWFCSEEEARDAGFRKAAK